MSEALKANREIVFLCAKCKNEYLYITDNCKISAAYSSICVLQ